MFASVFHQRLPGDAAKFPELGVGDPANVLLQGLRRSPPPIFSTGFCPKVIGRTRVPGRHVNTVSHVSDGNFVLWPSLKKRLKEAPAHLPMQATYAIHRSASADCQVSHVETFRRVIRILSAESQHIL